MSELPARKSKTFEGLWPWPCVPLTLLLAIWSVYMGTMAEANDLSTAFYGLSVIFAIVGLLGLRASNVRRARFLEIATPAQILARGRNKREVDLEEDELDDDVEPEGFYREPYVATAEPAAASGILDVEPQRNDMDQPNNDRAERRAARQRKRAQTANDGEVSQIAASVSVPHVEERDIESFEDVAAALQDIEYQLARESAERNAVLAHLAERRDGDSGVALEERLNNYLTIAAFNAAMAQKVFPRVEATVRREIRGTIGPEAVMEKMQAPPSQDGDKDASFTFALQLAEARQALEAHIEEVQNDRTELRNDIRNARRLADRAVRMMETKVGEGEETEQDLVSVVRDLRVGYLADRERLAGLEAALKGLQGAPAAEGNGVATTSGGTGEGVSSEAAVLLEYKLGQRITEVANEGRLRTEDVFRALDNLKTMVDERTDTAPASPEQIGALRRQMQVVRVEVQKNKQSAEAEIAALRSALETATSALQEISGRLDALSAGAPHASPSRERGEPAQTPAGGDVDSLRDALTTIIDQNRVIREQQQELSSRLDQAEGESRT